MGRKMVLKIAGEPIICDNPEGRPIYTVDCEEQQGEHIYTYTYVGGLEWGADEKPILSGNGILSSDTGRKVYEGNLKCGAFNGEGTYYFPGEGKYEGNWRNGRRDGFGTRTNQEGYVYERLYSNGSLEEDTPISREFYGENGEISDRASGKRRKLYRTKYEENGCSTVTYNYYGPDGILEKKLKVNYRKLNELLNEGRLGSIVPAAIEDVTEGLEENERIGTLEEAQEYLRVCARQILQDKMHPGEQGLEGGADELQNLMLLADLGDPEIRRVRFSDQPNEEKMKRRYDNVGALLESIGIRPENIGNIDGDFITIEIATTNGAHSISAIIDLERLRELKENGENIATTNEQVIFILDGSRAIGNPDPKYKECNLGNIQGENCMVVNRAIQRPGSCWYHSVSFILAVAENPDIVRDLRESARVERSKPEGQSPWEFWFMGRQLARFVGFANPEVQSIRELPRPRDKLLTEFETKQMLQLQKIANRYDIGVIHGELTSKLLVLKSVRDGAEEFSADNKLLGSFEERINALIEKKEKELKASFSEETRKSLREGHKNKLSEEIRNITPESIRGKYGTGADPEGEKFLQILERIEAFHTMEDRFKDVLVRARKVNCPSDQQRSWWRIGSWLPGLVWGKNNTARLEIVDANELNSSGREEDETGQQKAMSSSSIMEDISSGRGENKNPRESRTLTIAEELSRVESALESLSSEVTRELTK